MIKLIKKFFEWKKVYNNDDFLHNLPFRISWLKQLKNISINKEVNEIARFNLDGKLYIISKKQYGEKPNKIQGTQKKDKRIKS